MADDSDVADRIAREVFGLLCETSSEAGFIVDRATRQVLSVNVRAGDLLSCEVGSLIGAVFDELVLEDRDLRAAGHYEEVALRGSDGYPVFVELNVVELDVGGRTVTAYAARDTSEHRVLQRELVAKHAALFTAHAELERAHAELGVAKRELEARTEEIALLAWRAAMGELVAGIAHHLNNPVGALASTLRQLTRAAGRVPNEHRGELDRLVGRAERITRRVELNVAAIVTASRSAGHAPSARPELPPQLSTVLSTFTGQLEDIPTKDQP